MISEIARTIILGKTLAFWLGIVTILFLFCTASTPTLNQKKWVKIPVKYHILLARITVCLAILHGLFIASIYFGF